jgi:hypothetical protein
MREIEYSDQGGVPVPVVNVDGRELVYTGDPSPEAIDQFVDESRVALWAEAVSEGAAKAVSLQLGPDQPWEDIQPWLWDLLGAIGDEYGIQAPILLPEQAVVMITSTLAKNWPLMAFLEAQRIERDIWEGLHPGGTVAFGARVEGPSGQMARNLVTMLASLTEDQPQT